MPDLTRASGTVEPVTPATQFQPGRLSPNGYLAAVTAAIGSIRRGELSKVVLARDLVGQLPAGATCAAAIDALGSGYPDCWTFAVDGLIGSSPETLVSVDHGTVSARVLAGSAARGADAASDQEAAVALATSAKDQDEHQYAVQSVLASLRRHSADVTASEVPFTLKLPNLWHLASDIEGTLVDGSTSLDLLAAMHPTAAVAGTPTAAALDLIESWSRSTVAATPGRSAGWARTATASGRSRCAAPRSTADGTVTAHAGAGIVAESIAEHELAETRMKFRPIVEAFG